MKKLIISIVCALLLLLSFASCKSADTSIANKTYASEDLQSQMCDLTNKLSAYSSVVSQLQSQIKALESSATSLANEQVSKEIDTINRNIKKINTTIDTIENQIVALQSSLQAAKTTIGTSSVTVNGLSLIFITNDVRVGVTGSTTPSIAQFAIKIINTTNSALTNVDVTGTITGTQCFSGFWASGYPKLADGAGLCSYAFSHGGTNVMHFEAYSNVKTSLSIPAGGSITLRPKLSLLAMDEYQLQPMSFVISLDTITYDVTSNR